MATPFSKITNIFLNEIDDKDLALIEESDLIKYLDDLIIVSANADFVYCTKDLNKYTESTLVTEGSFTDDLTLEECNIIAKYVLLRYLNQKINSQDLLRIELGDKDYKMSSGHMLLSALLKLKESTLEDIYNLRFTYIYRHTTSDDFI
jgi:hypothetical protein